MRIARRSLFFLGLAIVSLLLLEPTPAEFRWVNLSMAGLALFWFVLLSIEDLSQRRQRPTRGPEGGETE